MARRAPPSHSDAPSTKGRPVPRAPCPLQIWRPKHSPTRTLFTPAPQVFGSLSITFWLLAAGVYVPAVAHAAGYIGAFCGLSAIYTAFAEIYHESLGIRAPGLAPVRFI